MLDDCMGDRNFSDGMAGKGLVGSQMQQFKSTCWSIIGIKTNAIKSASGWGVLGIGLLGSLNITSKGMDTIVVVIKGLVSDDGTRAVV